MQVKVLPLKGSGESLPAHVEELLTKAKLGTERSNGQTDKELNAAPSNPSR